MLDATATNLAHGLGNCLTREGSLIRGLKVVRDSSGSALAEERARYDQTLRTRTTERDEAWATIQRQRPRVILGTITIYGGAAVGGLLLINSFR